jgi:ribosome-binding protein aMBF1 (putative translation factor)
MNSRRPRVLHATDPRALHDLAREAEHSSARLELLLELAGFEAHGATRQRDLGQPVEGAPGGRRARISRDLRARSNRGRDRPDHRPRRRRERRPRVLTVANRSDARHTSEVPKLKTFTDSIRKAILDAPLSRYALSKRLTVSQATLSGFVNGKHGIGTELLDVLARELGLRVVVAPKAKAKSKARRKQ